MHHQWPCSQVAPEFLCNLLLGGSIPCTYQAKKKKPYALDSNYPKILTMNSTKCLWCGIIDRKC